MLQLELRGDRRPLRYFPIANQEWDKILEQWNDKNQAQLCYRTIRSNGIHEITFQKVDIVSLQTRPYDPTKGKAK